MVALEQVVALTHSGHNVHTEHRSSPTSDLARSSRQFVHTVVVTSGRLMSIAAPFEEREEPIVLHYYSLLQEQEPFQKSASKH